MMDTFNLLDKMFPWAISKEEIIKQYIDGKLSKEEYLERMREYDKRGRL